MTLKVFKTDLHEAAATSAMIEAFNKLRELHRGNYSFDDSGYQISWPFHGGQVIVRKDKATGNVRVEYHNIDPIAERVLHGHFRLESLRVGG